MLRIKSDMGMVAMQRYINKKAVKGYRLKSIVPFILFPEIRVHMLTDFRKDVPESRKRQDILLRSCLCSPRLDHRVLQHSRSACGHRPRRTGSRILDVAHSHRGLLHQILRDRHGGQV